MSRIELSETVPEGVVLSEPYFEIGQVLLVRANETEIVTWRDISAEMNLAVVEKSAGATTAKDILRLPDRQIVVAADTAAAVQLLNDFAVRAVIINQYDAENYAERYYQRLRLAGQESADYVISQQQYALAVAANNPQLLARLNAGIAEMQADQVAADVAAQWLAHMVPIQAGDSLIGTPSDRLLIGAVGVMGDFNPASTEYTPLNWEIKQNIFSGLLGFDARNQLLPVLAESLPVISAENTIYTFTLREGLTFADGTPLDASAVKISLQRAAATANPLFGLLKDSNLDGFADEDAIQIIDERQIVFVLDEADSTFLSRMATPAYAIVNPRCDVSNFDPTESCSGIAPYQVTSWEPGFALRLEANPLWPLTPARMQKVELRVYATSAEMSTALANSAIDIAWLGLSESDDAELRARSGIRSWQGPGIFKSYLIFEQSEESDSPWDDVRLRQAAALAVDREAIVEDVFEGTRKALYSPLPAGMPGQVSAEPERNLAAAITLLQSAGYSSSNKLKIDIWYLNDGRYSDREEQYAQAIEAQLEETDIFDVTLNGAGWGVYSSEMSSCNYPAFLLGWPPSARLPYLDGMNWIAHFVYNASSVCSNYESTEMVALLDQLFETVDSAARTDLYATIQQLWAEEYPTLDLYQQTRDALALNKVTELQIDGLGMLRYDTIGKE